MMKKKTIEEMQTLAEYRGGKCLSQVYSNARSKLQWQCKEGHKWAAVPYAIKHGNWCPKCAWASRIKKKTKFTLRDMAILAAKKDGFCISKKYAGGHAKLKWKCKEGHIWSQAAYNIKIGTWCPYCCGKRGTTIATMQALAKSKGGRCLSKRYIDNKTKLLWRCKNGHEWMASPISIKRVSWCPICSRGVSERICMKMFERMFGEKFPKSKPDWLRNKRGIKMELDGYCEKLHLAFEYQGIQHYKSIKKFFNGRNLKEQIEADELKKKLCKQHDVNLIIVPYNIEYDSMQAYIIKECKKIQITNYDSKKIDHRTLDAYSPLKILEMQGLARQRGGRCLSKVYINSKTNLTWKCAKGHIWEAPPISIITDRWCLKCSRLRTANKQRDTIENMRALARQKEGFCLSKKYVNAHTKLKWKCKNGHLWLATPTNLVTHGRWCAKCAFIRNANLCRLGIDKMRDVAKVRGGFCLSDHYANTKTKLKWRCKEGHEWKAAPDYIIYRKRWCPICARTG